MNHGGNVIEQEMLAFQGGMDALGFPVSCAVEEGVRSWLSFRLGWKGRRVTGFQTPGHTAVKLVVDSFAFQLATVPSPESRLIDIGSGNGWPGLALKLTEPCLDTALLDSRLGACSFMKGYAEFSSLRGIQVLCQRGEDASKDRALRESFDLVTSRAMGDLAVVAEIASGFLALGGRALLWLGPEHKERLESKADIPGLGLTLEAAIPYELPFGLGYRILGVYEKTSTCFPRFPRRLTAIKRNPLL